MGFLNDSDLNVAVFGLVGVVIGGLLTVLSQSLARRDERLHQLKQEVAETIALAHMIRSSFNSIHVDQVGNKEARQTYASALTRDIPEFTKKCQTLTVIGPFSVRRAALKLVNAGHSLVKYAHTEVGTGRAEDFKSLNDKASPVGRCEDTLAGVVRCYWWLRWPYLIWRRMTAERQPTLAA